MRFKFCLVKIIMGCNFVKLIKCMHHTEMHFAVPWMSARHNFLALFASAAPSTIHCVHGIRFLSMAWVMFGHKFYYSTFLAPPPAMAASKMPWTSGVLLNTYLSVDTFLLISALLSARAIARAGTLNVPLFYALRCARIWPPLAAVVFFTTCASAVVGSGPLWWPLVVSEAGFCQKRWWTALIFLNNYIDNGNSVILILWCVQCVVAFFGMIIFY